MIKIQIEIEVKNAKDAMSGKSKIAGTLMPERIAKPLVESKIKAEIIKQVKEHLPSKLSEHGVEATVRVE